MRQLTRGQRPTIIELEPRVPFSQVPQEAFTAEEAFDMISIARSPAYTPEACDRIYDEIRRRYIEER